MESGLTGYKGQGLSAFDKKPLAERFGNKQVRNENFLIILQLLNKKVPLNPKYADVKSVIDHGKSLKNVEVQQDSLIAKKKGENFGRILPKTLARFLSESNNEESVIGLMRASEDKENFETMSVASSLHSQKSETVQSVVTT